MRISGYASAWDEDGQSGDLGWQRPPISTEVWRVRGMRSERGAR